MPEVPIALSDSAMTTLMNLAAPLSPTARSKFLEAVAARLAGADPPGDGAVFRVAAELQREFWTAPDLSRGAGTSKYR